MNTKKMCDATIYQAVEQMQENGADLDMILDRLMTFAVAQNVSHRGTFAVAELHRTIADKIDAGIFAHLEPTTTEPKH